MAEEIYLEQGHKRVFACALDWPGWCRVARDGQAAMTALAAYAVRYARVAAEAGVAFPPADAAGTTADRFTVVERVAGSGATDFGVPNAVPEADATPLDEVAAARHANLVEASWRVFDRVAHDAPAVLRKGPRGGGRDRDEIVSHVAESERAYARKLGIRRTPAQFARPGGRDALRAEIVDVLRAARDGDPLVDKGWPPRYAARRIAWHVLDHVWEIEDKSD